jgi:UDP-N-acetylglucosamine 2-epimerase (non-hydrolysing)/GDP/UDP-N,N'-diacetylbacillosamine 2-epimerase (hydrolysing)
MNKKRKVLFITERRADYSRLKPILELAKKSRKLEIIIVATGLHFLKSFGETKQALASDGFKIDFELPVYRTSDKDCGATMARAFGQFVLNLTDVAEKVQPDLIFCGFDLGAHLAAAVVGMNLNIPVAHIQGGERSGTIDEVLRHATTKFSHIHFVATEESRERVIKLGENPKYVFLVGSPSLNNIKHVHYVKKGIIMKKFGIDPEKPLIIFLQHPVTTEIKEVERQIGESIAGLKTVVEKYGAQVFAIYSNNDAGGKCIVNHLEHSNFIVQPHVSVEDFLQLLNVANALVGNSSAGIHEAPSFGLPTVNIGTRQQYRERGVNIIDAPNDRRAIELEVKKCLFDKQFIAKVKKGKNPYDHGDTAKKIVKILETLKFPPIQKVITY